MNKKIEFYRTDEGDWEIVRCPDDDFAMENHRLDSYDWIAFLEHLGFSVSIMTVSDDSIQDVNWQ